MFSLLGRSAIARSHAGDAGARESCSVTPACCLSDATRNERGGFQEAPDKEQDAGGTAKQAYERLEAPFGRGGWAFPNDLPCGSYPLPELMWRTATPRWRPPPRVAHNPGQSAPRQAGPGVALPVRMTRLNIHDLLFRGVFCDPDRAAEVLQWALPAFLSDHVDWTRVRLLPGDFVHGDPCPSSKPRLCTSASTPSVPTALAMSSWIWAPKSSRLGSPIPKQSNLRR